MNAFKVIYPQYWLEPNCESIFMTHLSLIKRHYCTFGWKHIRVDQKGRLKVHFRSPNPMYFHIETFKSCWSYHFFFHIQVHVLLIKTFLKHLYKYGSWKNQFGYLNGLCEFWGLHFDFFLKWKNIYLLDFFILSVMNLQCRAPQNFEHFLQIH